MKSSGMLVSTVVVIFLVVATSALVYRFLEWERPQVKVVESFDMIGQKKDVNIKIVDARSGIRNVRVTLVQKEKEFELASVDIPEQGVSEKTVAVEIRPRKLRMKDGDAVLRVQAIDHSPLKNKTVLEKNVVIDTVPLSVSLLTMSHNVNPGGTCMAAYGVSKEVVKCGVTSGAMFFPGYPVTDEQGKKYYVCYFAVPIDVSGSTIMSVMASDKAGNQAVTSIPFYVRKAHTFRDDTLSVSPDFIMRKATELQQADPDLEGKSLEETFTFINDKMRKENESAIQSICLKTADRKLWKGGFLMMKNGATRARFGDKRTYKLLDKTVGNSLHQGIDVASLKHAPIEASNSGIVLFTGFLGIYGNTVIIDHGQGISSLYSHLSSIGVKEGQEVQKEQVIGNSGMTGWAGGDHLHVSMLVNGVFVNPIEWWDTHWIKDNVEGKLPSF